MPDPNTKKPGFLTTEFWVSLLSVIAIVLKIWGIDISEVDQSALAESIVVLLGGFLAILAIVTRYIKSRSQVKVAELETKVMYQISQTSTQPVTFNLTRR